MGEAAYRDVNRPKLGTSIALASILTVGGFTAVPILAIGVGSGGAASGCVAVVDDGTPSLLGPATLSATDLRDWWSDTGREQPERLRLDVDDLIALYLSEGNAEGVRGDIAFAQAVLETGYFTNGDTSINNYAGIGHYDNASSGTAFADPVIGVRAHIQLLKKYALGNAAPLVRPDVAPSAGAMATTWGGLAGTWASAPNYWTSISVVYDAMTAHAGSTPAPVAVTFDPLAPPTCPTGELAISGDYSLPLERRWYDEHPDWFTRPHHDYPAIDIPVPVGTPLYAVTNGVVVGIPTSGRCGIGVVLNGDDGAQYTYCHGQPGTLAMTVGDRVVVGQYLLNSASTGSSTGPHLHFGIETGGAKRCPQTFLVSIAIGQPLTPLGLPTTGCIS